MTLDDLLTSCTSEDWFVQSFTALHERDWVAKALARGNNPNPGYTSHGTGPTPLAALLNLRQKLDSGDIIPPPPSRSPVAVPASLDLLSLLNLRTPAPIGKVRRLP